MRFNPPLTKWPSVLSSFVLLASLVCFTQAQQPTPRAEAPISAPSSAPSSAPISANDAYRIRSGDKLSLKFLYQPELNEPSVLVRPDGLINLSMIDEVMARGLTVVELKGSLEKAYSEILLNPVISINLVEFVAPRTFIAGQVAKPGSYELRAGQTLMQVIALAGGFTRDANRKMVLHARPIGEGKLKMATFDVTRMLSDSGAPQEVSLQDGDYVFVPDSKLSKMSRVIEAFRAVIPGIGIGY
ncbi:MAG: polysaccharide export protein [Acidobacteria bacterium]|nr:polysaccharide export protein [Acidobacteriota bacterium]